MKARITRLKCIILTIILTSAIPSYGADAFSVFENNINGSDVNYLTIDMKNSSIKPLLLTANNGLSSADSVVSMSEYAGAVAAVCGSPFDNTGGLKLPVGTLIKDGKLIHTGTGVTAGIKMNGDLLIDRVTFDIFGYINGDLKAIPWAVNQITGDSEGIVVFTPEFGVAVPVAKGCKAVIVSGGYVSHITSSDFLTPSEGFAILYNPGVVYMVAERYKIGDKVSYDYKIKTVKTSPSDWENVVVAVGAEADLIINEELTAGQGFKTLSGGERWKAVDRAFLGSTQDGRLFIGAASNATIYGIASICQLLGLKNAVSLNSADYVSLYYNGSALRSGKDVNNSLGFADINSINALRQDAASATANEQKISVGGAVQNLRGYNISGYNYFMLRDIAYILRNTKYKFSVDWNNASKTISANKGKNYKPVGTELNNKGVFESRQAQVGNASLVVDGTTYDFVVYNFEGNNYYKIRDLGEAMNFPVEWDAGTKTIIIE